MRENLTAIVCDALQNDRCIRGCNHPPCAMVQRIVDELIENDVKVPVMCKDCLYHRTDGLCRGPHDIRAGEYADLYTEGDHFCAYGV